MVSKQWAVLTKMSLLKGEKEMKWLRKKKLNSFKKCTRGGTIHTEPSRYRHHSSMHEALQRIQVILPNQKEGDAAMQHGLITSRQQKNSKWRELRI